MQSCSHAVFATPKGSDIDNRGSEPTENKQQNINLKPQTIKPQTSNHKPQTYFFYHLTLNYKVLLKSQDHGKFRKSKKQPV